jgi:tetratricopeptide (TPR) repeat protein
MGFDYFYGFIGGDTSQWQPGNLFRNTTPIHPYVGAPPGGCGLGSNTGVVACRAEWLHHQGRHEECYALTERALERDPYATECLPPHLAAALALGRKNELFLRGHQLVEEYPDSALSWFAVGCYYMAARHFEAARRHFSKATALDRNSAHAWVGFGHAFAAQVRAGRRGARGGARGRGATGRRAGEQWQAPYPGRGVNRVRCWRPRGPVRRRNADTINANMANGGPQGLLDQC